MAAGGKRDGSGRKALPDEEKRVTVTFRVTPDTKEILNFLRKKGIPLGRAIDRMAEDLLLKLQMKIK